MSTLNEQLYIDAVVVYGTKRIFSVKINQAIDPENPPEDPTAEWDTLDLSDYNIRFRVLGSAEGDGVILVEKLITQVSDEDEVGIIEEPTTGEFTFVITAEETELLGIGSRPITLELLDVQSGEVMHVLTEGGVANAEFNKITVVRV